MLSMTIALRHAYSGGACVFPLTAELLLLKGTLPQLFPLFHCWLSRLSITTIRPL